jgi:hypothetical protein
LHTGENNGFAWPAVLALNHSVIAPPLCSGFVSKQPGGKLRLFTANGGAADPIFVAATAHSASVAAMPELHDMEL